MSDFLPAQHFDGRGAEGRDAQVRVEAAGVRVRSASGDEALWPFAELVLVRGQSRGEPVQLERRGATVEVVVVEAPVFRAELFAALPRGRRLAGHGGWRVGGRTIVAIVGLLVVAALAAWRFGVPLLADVAAAQVPGKLEREFGDPMLADFAPPARRITDSRVERPVHAMFDRLAAGGGKRAEGARLVLVRDDLVNAFAAPGGTVVVTSGLLRAMRSPEELAAVLAHELGHVERRHSLRGLMRQASLQLLLAVVAGDASPLASGLQIAGALGGLSYSRAFEREADDAAMAALRREGRSPGALAGALERIRSASPAGLEVGFLSTHPAPAERLARIRRAEASFSITLATTPLVSEQEWRALQAALPPPESTKATR